ncbi:transcriptional regulator [Paenibacillus sp. MY03]|nr:transcriptional regulator [Paenibacillus sp. MY03]
MELKKNQDTCEIFCYDEDKVNRVREKLSKNDFQDMAQIFKVLADHTRLKVAYALCDEDELCVCDVANIIGSTMATASHHLRLLRNMGIANYRKEGKLVFYSLGDEQLKQMIRLAIEHQKEVVSVE